MKGNKSGNHWIHFFKSRVRLRPRGPLLSLRRAIVAFPIAVVREALPAFARTALLPDFAFAADPAQTLRYALCT